MDAIIKSKIKLGTCNDIGNELDDRREAARRMEQQYCGAMSALGECAKKILDLNAHIERERNGTGHNEVRPNMSTDEVCALLKRWVQRASGVAESLSDNAKINQIQQAGQAKAFEEAIKYVKRIYDTEEAKVRGIEQAIKEGVVTEDGQMAEVISIDQRGRKVKRPTGVHPRSSLRSRRGSSNGESSNEDGETPIEMPEESVEPVAAEKPITEETAQAAMEGVKKSLAKKNGKRTKRSKPTVP